MRNIIVTMWMTLDGFIDDLTGEMQFVKDRYDDAMLAYEDALVSTADTLLLGRGTYENFVRYWSHVPDQPDADPGEVAYARKLNAMQKIVVSTTLPRVEWTNSTLMREIVPEEIEHLKQEPGRDIVIYGSARLIQTLAEYGLIDEYQLVVHPCFLGEGKPLFTHLKERVNVRLVNTQTLPSGVVVLTYRAKECRNAAP